MRLKTMTRSAILMAIGLILHAIIPSFFGFMKPDFMLSMMFISIFLSNSYQEVIGVGVMAGLLSGLTSAMPGGLIANFIDKIITASFVFMIKKNIENKMIVSFISTIISGLIFLSISSLIVKIPMDLFIKLVFVHVLPAALINSIFVKVLCKYY